MDKYTKNLQNELKEAHETIGALVSCIDKLIDCDERFRNIARKVIDDVRAKRGKANETNRK